MTTSLLARSAQGASFLILLQVASRGLTFVVNQVLLRYLSPQILGIATQLELFSISTLYFSRESIRVAITRQGAEEGQSGEQQDLKEAASESNRSVKAESKKNASQITDSQNKIQTLPDKSSQQGNGKHRRVQEVVNISWIAINLGVALTFIFEWLYIQKADAAVLATPYIIASLHINGLAVIIELLNEPCFAVSQQEMMYGMRAIAEMQATFTRCIVTCATAIIANRHGTELGVLPFAFGQLTYAFVLNVNYFLRVTSRQKNGALALMPAPVKETGEFVPSTLFNLACTFYGQSLFKQLLTSGDQYLIASLTSLASQGAYALASNYGSLLARVLFQPLEESSRALFARLIPSSTDYTDVPGAGESQDKPSTVNLGTKQAASYLARLLHAYLILGILLFALGPPLSRPALAIVAGSRWSQTEAPLVLASYCYYIPLLALNGVLEAFVAAVATPAQLRTQSLWMVAFSVLFACSGFVVLGQWNMGARGLVLANAVTMAGRICWSFRFVQTEVKARGGHFDIDQILPGLGSAAIGVGARAVLERFDLGGENFIDLATGAAVAGACGMGILFNERSFLMDCYLMLRPNANEKKKD